MSILFNVGWGGVKRGFLEKVIFSLRFMSWNEELKWREGGVGWGEYVRGKKFKVSEKGICGEK